MTTKSISRGWQGKQVSSFGNFRRDKKPNNPAIIQTGLQLYYDFGNGLSFDNTSTTIKSVGATSFDGTLTNGPAYSTTYNGMCTFDGVNDYITRTAALNTGQNFSVFAWVNMASVGTTRNSLLSNASPYLTTQGWYLSIGQGGGNNRFFLSTGLDQAYSISANNAITVGQWQFVGAAVTNGGSNIKLYNNGRLQPTSLTSFNTVSLTYTQNEFDVGRRDPAQPATDYFNGSIGQVAIYSQTHSDSEMWQNFNATRVRYGL